jgi:hypothetical protein
MYRAGSLRAVAEKSQNITLIEWEYRKSDGTEMAQNQQPNIRFSMESGMKIMN